uniref:Transcriptional regulator, AraC family n=1 Tax=Parastrongyloides trichosuri TaxID=131310 RepID=A0A0N4ZWL0_PARTI
RRDPALRRPGAGGADRPPGADLGQLLGLGRSRRTAVSRHGSRHARGRSPAGRLFGLGRPSGRGPGPAPRPGRLAAVRGLRPARSVRRGARRPANLLGVPPGRPGRAPAPRSPWRTGLRAGSVLAHSRPDPRRTRLPGRGDERPLRRRGAHACARNGRAPAVGKGPEARARPGAGHAAGLRPVGPLAAVAGQRRGHGRERRPARHRRQRLRRHAAGRTDETARQGAGGSDGSDAEDLKILSRWERA